MEKGIIEGIHHITVITGNAQINLDYYSGILGLRLVKKTINFDAPDVYHLYYGDGKGNPGTIITFFPYPGLKRGRKGNGQVTKISFSVGLNSLEYWLKRLKKFGISASSPQTRFNKELYITFQDFDGLDLELVESGIDPRVGAMDPNIPPEMAIKGLYGVEIMEEGYETTAGILTQYLDHFLLEENGNRFRFSTENKNFGFIDLLCTPDSYHGSGGGGIVHHLAFSTPNQESQILTREKLVKNGFNPTPVLDREYFKSIYFREPGGVLFEIATIPPGFSVDEDLDQLGTSLKLPPWYEPRRNDIEKQLSPIYLNLKDFRD